MWGMCAVILNLRLMTTEKNFAHSIYGSNCPCKSSNFQLQAQTNGSAPVIWTPPHPSYSLDCVSLGGGFTSSRMNGGFTFNLSVVAFSCHLVIWTFDINYLCSSRPCCLFLEMLFKVWWGDLRKAVTNDSTQGTLVCTAEYQGAGTSFRIFAPVSGNFTGFHTHTEWISPLSPGWGGVGWGGVGWGGVIWATSFLHCRRETRH